MVTTAVREQPTAEDKLQFVMGNRLQRFDGKYRVYVDRYGRIYHSVTRIIGETSDKSGLENWYRLMGNERATQIKELAATRGTRTHDQAEYMLKTAQKIGRYAAKKRRVLRTHDSGLIEIPTNLTRWALEETFHSLPRMRAYFRPYAVPLTEWIRDHVTQIYACELSIHYRFPSPTPARVFGKPFDGFAGTMDGVLSIDGSGPLIVDWKTSDKPLSECPDKAAKYIDQLGAYWLGFRRATGVEPQGGAIVSARRLAEPEVIMLTRDEIERAAERFMSRCELYGQTGSA